MKYLEAHCLLTKTRVVTNTVTLMLCMSNKDKFNCTLFFTGTTSYGMAESIVLLYQPGQEPFLRSSDRVDEGILHDGLFDSLEH